MEASALQAPAGVARSRISIGAPLLRLRSDEQLVSLFRSGHEDAFRVIHDRYRQRLFAYARQMLPGSRQDAEDALQDVFVRAYSALRANDRDVALRAWLYRIAHNRCIDELRRPPVPVPELIDIVRSPIPDPIAEAEQRESLRRLIADIRRLPEQQRSALLMRELSGMTYSELAIALGISIPAVKSLLVRARVGLAQAAEARETSCSTIRDELIAAHDRRQRPNATARRHLRDCAACRDFRSEMRGVSHQLAALAPTVGPLGVVANLLGIGGGAGGGAAAAGGAAASGVLASGAAGHVATILAAAVVTAGGAVEIQHSISTPVKHHPRHHVRPAVRPAPQPNSGTPERSPVVINTSSVSAVVREVAPPTPVAPPQRQVATATKQASPGRAPRAGTLGGFTVPPTSGGSAPTDPSAGDPAGTTPGSSSTGTTSTTGPTNGATTSNAPGGASASAPSGTSSSEIAPPTATLSTGPSSGTRAPSGAGGSSTTPTGSGSTSTTASTGSGGTTSTGTSTGSVGLSN